MLTLFGQKAHSEFRLQKLQRDLQQHYPTLDRLESHFIYFIDTIQTLTDPEKQLVTRLLQANQWLGVLPPASLLVTPRVGTISSWSSKASDIFHHVSLSAVIRVERGLCYTFSGISLTDKRLCEEALFLLHDRMTENYFWSLDEVDALFVQREAQSYQVIDVLSIGVSALETVNQSLGLGLSPDDLIYLEGVFRDLNRNPTDVEIMMFAQVNSEHCRHKIFNASWVIDKKTQKHSLFQMIRHTHATHPGNVLVAYSDNAAVTMGHTGTRLQIDSHTHQYRYESSDAHLVIKVETHNHPTAISPYPGAATGVGGEIRDEGATGRGARPKAGLCGFSVSHLHVPGFAQPWEYTSQKPTNMASALTIMLQAPIGAASFGNEFGRPQLCGYFRTFEHLITHAVIPRTRPGNQTNAPGPRSGPRDDNSFMEHNHHSYGYHKPIMIAGGIGTIDSANLKKHTLPEGTAIVVLGGPGMQIGLGGGAASSMTLGQRGSELDFASVQRDNPEMQRRCQEVINRCVALGSNNPILSIHDVGAGGLANAIPEILHTDERGGQIDLRAILTAEPDMTPLAIWCNEAQERYVLAISNERLSWFQTVAARERCPYSIVGQAGPNFDSQLLVYDGEFDNRPIDLPMAALLGQTPKMLRIATHHHSQKQALDLTHITLNDAITRVLQFPTVAAKNFLITIADRSVGGLVARDQLIGPKQMPVSDVAVTLTYFQGYTGEAMAMGERSPVALLNPAASARLAIAESITNIMSADIAQLSDITLSANWMAACQEPGVDAALFDAVKAVGLELCPALGLCIPVGKDSLSMQTRWQDSTGSTHQVTSPVSLIASAYAKVQDARHTLTPLLRTDVGDTDLILIDLGCGKNRLGASILAQVYQQLGDEPADLDSPDFLKALFDCLHELKASHSILAYHDRSDGGLLVTLCEMAFASQIGLDIRLPHAALPLNVLFSEELGVVIQVQHQDTDNVFSCLREYGLNHHSHLIAQLREDRLIQIHQDQQLLYQAKLQDLLRLWWEPSYRMQSLRDHAACAESEWQHRIGSDAPDLFAKLTFPFDELTSPMVNKGAKPRVAILREQGVNGHYEMAAAFETAGFECFDVHMTDLIDHKRTLKDFKGLAACGGFSYGDVLGAGRGWASTILYHQQTRHTFEEFFNRKDTFTLGVCNGCQMLAELHPLIQGAELWPRFGRNQSEQFEARLVMVEILPSPSIFFHGMQGSQLPIVVSHGEGQVDFGERNAEQLAQKLMNAHLVPLQYIDPMGQSTTCYPFNPNGSLMGITGLTTPDGRVTLLMPHPERVVRSVSLSWHPPQWGEVSPWLQLFTNARRWS